MSLRNLEVRPKPDMLLGAGVVTTSPAPVATNPNTPRAPELLAAIAKVVTEVIPREPNVATPLAATSSVDDPASATDANVAEPVAVTLTAPVLAAVAAASVAEDEAERRSPAAELLLRAPSVPVNSPETEEGAAPPVSNRRSINYSRVKAIRIVMLPTDATAFCLNSSPCPSLQVSLCPKGKTGTAF